MKVLNFHPRGPEGSASHSASAPVEVSELAGRVRWEVPALNRDPILGDRIESGLATVDGILQVRANSLSRRVLVVFDPEIVSQSRVFRRLEALVRTWDSSAPHGDAPRPARTSERGSAAAAAGDLARRGGSGLLVGALLLTLRLIFPGAIWRVFWMGAAALLGISAFGLVAEKVRRKESAIRQFLSDDPVFSLVSRYQRPFVRAALCSFSMRTLDLTPPILIGLAVGILATGPSALLAAIGLVSVTSQLWFLGLLSLGFWTAGARLDYTQEKLWRELSQRIQHDLRMEVYEHLQSLDMEYFELSSSGKLVTILQDDVEKVGQFFDVSLDEIFQAATVVLVIGSAFMLLPPLVALAVLVPIPLTLGTSFFFHRKLNRRYRRVREEASLFGHQLINNLGGILTIKSFTAENEATRAMEKRSLALGRSVDRSTALAAAYNPTMRGFVGVGFVIGLIWCGILASTGVISITVFSTLIYLSLRIWYPVTRLGNAFVLYQHSRAALGQMARILARQPTIRDGPLVLTRERVRGEIVFDRVNFSYRDSGQVLSDLDLIIPSQRVCGIVGPSGAGKSTLVKLILRFYDPGEGRVLIDGEDLRQFRLKDLRQTVGLVSQDVFLFYGTVRDNIAFGRPGVSLEEIVGAARAAIAHDFIAALPQGYDTVIGERGIKLSGGQRQRISIARAILKKPSILVLDEATSSVDNETEVAFQNSLARLAAGRTTVVIAHRLSTVQSADVIHVLDEGRLAEQGTHDELLRRAGLYASLWRIQSGSPERPADRTPGG